jgi:hypothetical protein
MCVETGLVGCVSLFLRSACPPLQNQESQHMNLLLPMLPRRFRAMERETESLAEQRQEIRRGQCQRRPSCCKHASSEAVSEFVAEILLISSLLYRLVSWHKSSFLTYLPSLFLVTPGRGRWTWTRLSRAFFRPRAMQGCPSRCPSRR